MFKQRKLTEAQLFQTQKRELPGQLAASIVHSVITNKQGGTIFVETAEGIDATFIVTLPQN